MNPERSLVRYSFMEFLSRCASFKYNKLLQKLKREAEENLEEGEEVDINSIKPCKIAEFLEKYL